MAEQGGDGLRGRRIYLTRMSDCGAEAVSAVCRAFGFDAVTLPPPDARSLSLGAAHLTGDECLPAKLTLGDYLKVMEAPGFQAGRAAFLMPTTTGPCRFGQYAPTLQKVFRELGQAGVRVVSPTSDDGYQGWGGAAPALAREIWRGLVATDILRKLLLATRPYERERGAADALYRRALDGLVRRLEQPGRAGARLAALQGALRDVREEFRALPADYRRGRLLIGVQGEIFCRMEEFSNQGLVRRLEAAGAEVWLADVAGWVWYCNLFQEDTLRLSGRSLSWEMLRARLRDRVQRADEAALYQPFAGELTGGEPAGGMASLIAAATPYLPHPGASGEMVLSAGSVDVFFRQGVDGVLDVSPFSCMNGLVSEALYPRQSREHAGLPIQALTFDGTARDQSLELEIFLEMARDFQGSKPHPRRYPPAFDGGLGQVSA